MKLKISASPTALVREIEELQQASSANLKERWRGALPLRTAAAHQPGSADPRACVPDSGKSAGWAEARPRADC